MCGYNESIQKKVTTVSFYFQTNEWLCVIVVVLVN